MSKEEKYLLCDACAQRSGNRTTWTCSACGNKNVEGLTSCPCGYDDEMGIECKGKTTK